MSNVTNVGDMVILPIAALTRKSQQKANFGVSLDDSEIDWNDGSKTDIKTNFNALTSVTSHNDSNCASIESAYDALLRMICLFRVMLVLQMFFWFK